jgi:hypothetical protein
MPSLRSISCALLDVIPPKCQFYRSPAECEVGIGKRKAFFRPCPPAARPRQRLEYRKNKATFHASVALRSPRRASPAAASCAHLFTRLQCVAAVRQNGLQ